VLGSSVGLIFQREKIKSMVIIYSLFSLVLLCLTLPPALYLGFLGGISFKKVRRDIRKDSMRLPRFDIIVPAHDEELTIERTLASLGKIDYPPALYRVHVIADNCSDRTAALASGRGARVHERQDSEKRGKGFALSFAFALLLKDSFADAFVVIDADTEVNAGLLTGFSQQLGAGYAALQADGGVLNSHDSWRTTLMAVAYAMINGVRSRARAALSLSCGLRGNGMCLTREVITHHFPHSYGLVEDIEYGIHLALAGIKVGFAEQAKVKSSMLGSGGAAAVAQRRRWELGRLSLARQKAVPLFYKAITSRNKIILDIAIDLLVPPLSYLLLAMAAGSGFELASYLMTGKTGLLTFLWMLAFGAIGIYVTAGISYSRLGFAAIRAMMYVPYFIIWKTVRAHPFYSLKNWIRTERI
jgi:cellulose synthase/poly-beta-1,6-N-acetylglucosamine synthase-like glycosyltransferase